MNENKEPEKKYVAFQRERQEPFAGYTKDEVDEKIIEELGTIIPKVKELLTSSEQKQTETLNRLVESWKTTIAELTEKINNCYTQEKIDTMIIVMQQRCNNIEFLIKNNETKFSQLESLKETLLNYLVNSDQAERVGDNVVIRENKKSRWRK